MLNKFKKMWRKAIPMLLTGTISLSAFSFQATASESRERSRDGLYIMTTIDLQEYTDVLLADIEFYIRTVEWTLNANKIFVDSISIGQPIQIQNSDWVYYPVMDENNSIVDALVVFPFSRTGELVVQGGGVLAYHINELLEDGGEYVLIADEYNNIYAADESGYSLLDPAVAIEESAMLIDNVKLDFLDQSYDEALTDSRNTRRSVNEDADGEGYINVKEPILTSDFDSIEFSDEISSEVSMGRSLISAAAADYLVSNDDIYRAFGQDNSPTMCGAASALCIMTGIGAWPLFYDLSDAYDEFNDTLGSREPEKEFGDTYTTGDFVAVLDEYNADYFWSGTDEMLDLDDIMDEIDDGRAIWEHSHKPGGGKGDGHIVVAVGYGSSNNSDIIYVMDPAYGRFGGYTRIYIDEDGYYEYDSNMYPYGYVSEIEY